MSEEITDRKSLFVRAIPFDATNDELTDFFSQFAPVKHAVIVNDAEQKSRGFGFVSFTSEEDTLAALAESKKSKFKNRLLRVDVAKRRERKDKSKGSIPSKKPDVAPERIAMQKTARVIIRNLPWSVKRNEQLSSIFKKYGDIKEVKIPKKPDGKMCGFAFVTMGKHAAAEKAVKGSQGLKIDGREVAVDFAVNKTHWGTLKEENEANNNEEEEQEEQEQEQEQEQDNEVEKENEEEKDTELDDNDDNENGSDDNIDQDEEDAKLLALEDESSEPRQKRNRQENYSVFVRNLPYDVTQESLKEHFEKLGPVKYALPVVDKETGLPKGTAFVAFLKNAPYEECLLNAPEIKSSSILLPDDVSPFYVFEGRIMQIAPAVDRESAARLAEKSANQRKELLGRVPKEQDKRNLYLLNEGRIGPNSKLASLLTQGDMDIRDRSYNLRSDQLNKNPTLHLSMTRLAIRNIPRAMTDKSLKQLGRKAIVEFATEVKEGKRQPLSKEEIDRSTKQKHLIWEKLGLNAEDEGKRAKRHGVVSQSKIINEVKGSGEYGRSRGYGFLEYRDHKHALMALRWLNAHEVTIPEIVNGLTDEQKKRAENEKLINKKRLVVEFAIENAQVLKRRLEQMSKGRIGGKDIKRKRDNEKDGETEDKEDGDKNGNDEPSKKRKKGNGGKKGNRAKGQNKGASQGENSGENGGEKQGLSQQAKFAIGKKRRMKRQGKK
ncbi:mRNA-binding ribosome biosynthesis protein [Martiniozyma asiatica (nom. inval.)]|nr:mRNA-binding ribosome biosynthesis protein [Martiniozyma asiatica]